MISVEVLELCRSAKHCGVTFSLLLPAEKFAADFRCEVQ